MPITLGGPVNYVGLEHISQDSGHLYGDIKLDNPGEIKSLKNVFRSGDILYGKLRPNLNKVWLSDRNGICSTDIFVVRPLNDGVLPALYAYIFRSPVFNRTVLSQIKGAQLPRIGWQSFANIEIPLPPLEVQREIVAEIEGYQRVIDGARAVIDNYRPHIHIDPDWPMVELSEIANKITDGTHTTPTYTDSGIPFLRVTDITKSNSSKKFISKEEHLELTKRCHPEQGDILYTKNGTIGVAKMVDWEGDFSIFVSLALIKPRRELVDSRFLELFLNSDPAYAQATSRSKSGTVTNLHLIDIKTIRVPLPSVVVQRKVVAEVDTEQALVRANQVLIERFEKKIQAAIGRVWGDGKHG